MIRLLFIIISSILIFVLNANSQQIDDIASDRPDQTESSEVLHRNFFQIESGFNIEKNNSDVNIKQTNYIIPEIMVRYGLLENAELRLAVNYLREEKSEEYSSERNLGLKPLELGIKIKLFNDKKIIPKTALLFSAEVPGTGNEIYNIKHISPNLEFLFNNEITDKIELGYNFGMNWDNEENKNSGSYTVSLGVSPTDKFSFYVESYGIFTKSVSPDFRIDYGISYVLLRNLMLDLSSGIGLSKVSPDYFIDFGFSIRLPR